MIYDLSSELFFVYECLRLESLLLTSEADNDLDETCVFFAIFCGHNMSHTFCCSVHIWGGGGAVGGGVGS